MELPGTSSEQTAGTRSVAHNISSDQQPPPSLQSIYISPWGGPGGGDWLYHFSPGALKRIDIRCGSAIDSLKFTTSDGIVSQQFGGSRGGSVSITFDTPRQRLIGISGTCGQLDKDYVVTSLRFHTSRGDYGPYGRESGAPFSLKMDGGIIVGFHGRSGEYLDALGVFVQSIN